MEPETAAPTTALPETAEPTYLQEVNPPTLSPTSGVGTPTFSPTSNATSAPPSSPPTEAEFVFPMLNTILYPDSSVDTESFFGASVAIDKRTIVIGIQDDDTGVGSAMVYKFNNGTFLEQAKLSPNDGSPTDDFGRAVAISNDFIIVGAQKQDAAGIDSGAAYIFERNDDDEWTEVAKLVAPDSEENERFGISVAIDRNVAIIGANGDDDNGENSGAAYIFTRVNNEWMFTQKLTASDGEAGDNYGFSVAIYGDQAVVGAVWDSEKSGSVYVYILIDGFWTVEGKFIADGGNPDDQFGWSVSMYEDSIAVGAFADDANGLDSGAVYVFEKDSNGVWDQQARVSPLDGEDNDHFGRSVDIHQDWLIVSAPFDDDVGLEAGSVYIYERDVDDWILQAKVLPEVDPIDFSEFGFGVAVSDDFFVVSSKAGNDTISDAFGNVYIYSAYRPGEPTGSPTTTPYPTTGPPSLSPTISPRPTTSMPSISMAPSNFTSSTPTYNPTVAVINTTAPSLGATTILPTSSYPTSLPSTQGSTSFPTFTKPPVASNVTTAAPSLGSNGTTPSLFPTSLGGNGTAPSPYPTTYMPTPSEPVSGNATDTTPSPSVASILNITIPPFGANVTTPAPTDMTANSTSPPPTDANSSPGTNMTRR